MDKQYVCRKCHGIIDAVPEQENITWYKRSQNYYYHKNCWDEFIDRKVEKSNDEWFDLLFALFTKDLKAKYDYFKIKAQVNKMLKDGMTMKGIYFTTYYIFLILKKEYKSEFGIGLVPFMYEESTRYWISQEDKCKGIMDQILKMQLIEQSHGVDVKIKKKPIRKRSEEPD